MGSIALRMKLDRLRVKPNLNVGPAKTSADPMGCGGAGMVRGVLNRGKGVRTLDPNINHHWVWADPEEGGGTGEMILCTSNSQKRLRWKPLSIIRVSPLHSNLQVTNFQRC